MLREIQFILIWLQIMIHAFSLEGQTIVCVRKKPPAPQFCPVSQPGALVLQCVSIHALHLYRREHKAVGPCCTRISTPAFPYLLKSLGISSHHWLQKPASFLLVAASCCTELCQNPLSSLDRSVVSSFLLFKECFSKLS